MDKYLAKIKPEHRRFFARIILMTILGTVFTAFLAATVIRSIDDILNSVGLSDFAVIFSALDHAVLELHLTIPAAIAFLYGLAVAASVYHRRARGKSRALCVAVAVPVGLILLILAVLVSAWLTEVNDIRFGTVLLSMYENIDAFSGM